MPSGLRPGGLTGHAPGRTTTGRTGNREPKGRDAVNPLQIQDDHYLAVRKEFIFKIDGSRPLLYSLDYINTQLYFLSPLEGLALSLLGGDKPFSTLRRMFASLFPGTEGDSLAGLLADVDGRIRSSPSQTGIGADGLIQTADAPIRDAQTFDPRAFVVSPSEYLARTADPKTSVRLETPINIYTVFTHRCLTDCVYCYADRSRRDGELPLARWRAILQDMRDLGIWMCSPDNGDTFARTDGIDLLECMLEHDMHFLLSTKAQLSREQIGRLVDAGFGRKVRGVVERRAQLSVDAADEDVSRRILRAPGVRPRGYLATVENFLAFGIMPKVKAVITGLNYHQAKPIVDLFHPCGAREFHFVRYHRSFHRHTDDLFVQPSHVASLRDQFQAIRDRYPDVQVVENLTQGPASAEPLSPERARALWDGRIGCGGGWSSLGIAPDGKAFLCEQMKMDAPYFVGDAQGQSIREIWDGEAMLRFIHPERELFKGTVCHECGEFEDCIWKKGRCYRDAYFSYGSIYDAPPLCPHNQRPGIRLG